MPAPILSPLPTVPSRTTPSVFPSQMEMFHNALVTFRNQLVAFGNWLGEPADALELQDAVDELDLRIEQLESFTEAPVDANNGWRVLLADAEGSSLLALTETGLHFKASDVLMSVISDVVQQSISENLGLETPHEAPETEDGWVLAADAEGNHIIRHTTTGLYFNPSTELVDDLRVLLDVPDAPDPLDGVDTQYVTASICMTQSLLFMDGADGDTAPHYPDVDPYTALMIGGLRRSDEVEVGQAGPRSFAYDYTHPGSGFVSPDPAPSSPSGAYYVVKGYNGWREKFGLIPRRNVGVLWGQAGDHITRYNNIMGDAPSPLVDNTNHWDNLMFWLDEMERISAIEGLIPRVDLLFTHGTSSKQDADPNLYSTTMRALIPALRAEFDARGFEDAAIYFTQPGGDTDTSPGVEHWEVTQSFVELAEQGYGILVAPESYLEIFDNNVHFGEIAGEKLLGMYNWARAAREAGRSWTIRRPEVTRIGNVVTLDYSSLWDGEMLEVEDNPYSGGIDSYMGYTSDSANITGMEIRGRQVVLTFDSVPTSIDYMLQKQDVSVLDDGYTAFRGRIVTTSRMRDPLNPTILHKRRLPSHSVIVS